MAGSWIIGAVYEIVVPFPAPGASWALPLFSLMVAVLYVVGVSAVPANSTIWFTVEPAAAVSHLSERLFGRRRDSGTSWWTPRDVLPVLPTCPHRALRSRLVPTPLL